MTKQVYSLLFFQLKIPNYINLLYYTKNISSQPKFIKQWSKYISKKITSIIDLTSNVGTESIYFAKSFHDIKITSFEIDPKTFKQLEENIQYTETQDVITPINKNSIQYVLKNKISGDLFLLDPPWTGESYKQNKQKEFTQYKENLYKGIDSPIPLETITLTINDEDLVTVINKLSPYFKTLALKIPLNEINAPTSNGYKNNLKNFKQQFVYIKSQDQIKYLVILISHK